MKKNFSIQKANILKKITGKRFAVITNHLNLDHFFGEVSSIIDEENVIVKTDKGEEFNISIFDLRNPNQEL